MTNDELIEQLDEFGGHIDVIILRETDTTQQTFTIQNVDYHTIAGEGYIVLEVEKVNLYAS